MKNFQLSSNKSNLVYILAYKMSTKLTEKDYPTAIVHGRKKMPEINYYSFAK